jgi:hypothetical protein
MKWKIANQRTGLCLIGAFILLVGLGSAAFIYQVATNDSSSASGYEVIGGFIYPSSGENSKKYMHDLELYGGKAAVLADEFMRWFAGLWHGTSLAYTVACITIIISLGVFLVAAHLPSRLKPEASRDRDRAGRGTN